MITCKQLWEACFGNPNHWAPCFSKRTNITKFFLTYDTQLVLLLFSTAEDCHEIKNRRRNTTYVHRLCRMLLRRREMHQVCRIFKLSSFNFHTTYLLWYYNNGYDIIRCKFRDRSTILIPRDILITYRSGIISRVNTQNTC